MARLVGDESFHQNKYASTLERIVSPGCRWLDLGAGKVLHRGFLGPTCESLAAHAGFLVGCDVVVDHLRLNPSLDASVGAVAEQLPFRRESFDLVTANMVVEHLPNPRAVFMEVRRVLRPGGGFVFVTPNRANPLIYSASVLLSAPLRKRLAAVVESREAEDVFPTYYRCNTARSIRAHASGADFEVRELTHFSTGPFLPRPLAVVWLECMFIRGLELPGLGELRSNIICHLSARPDRA